MSIISGLYQMRGERVDRASLARLIEIESYHGPDSSGIVEDERIGFAFRTLYTLGRENPLESQISTDSAGLRAISDARIDNREELLRSLFPLRLAETASESDLILQAYKKWGPACPRRILGDFAFAIWDSSEESLFCARDPLGIRSFFYFCDGRRFIFASLIRQLTNHPEVRMTLDDEYMADFLARADAPGERTAYRAVKRLLPGCSLLVKRQVIKNAKYWDLEPNSFLRYRTDQEYEEHFRELFAEAVRARVGAGKVAIELSGGLDSSSIACVGQQLVVEDPQHRRELFTVTDVPRSQRANETAWSRVVSEKCGIHNIELKPDERLFCTDENGAVQCWDEPTIKHLALPNIRARARAVSNAGSRVLLSGIGGDQLLLEGSPPYYLADLLFSFRFGQFSKEFSRWRPFIKQTASSFFLDTCIKPIVRPNVLFHLLRPSDGKLPWLHPHFERRYAVERRMLHRSSFLPRLYKGPACQNQYLNIRRTSALVVGGQMADVPLVVRYPYLDRRLVEFAMRIPMQQKLRPGESRSIQRRAMRGTLPENVRTRTSKGDFTQSVYWQLAKERQTLESWFAAPLIADLGYVDPVEFRRELGLVLLGSSRNFYQFFAALSLEIWLRGSEAKRSGNSRPLTWLRETPLAVPNV